MAFAAAVSGAGGSLGPTSDPVSSIPDSPRSCASRGEGAAHPERIVFFTVTHLSAVTHLAALAIERAGPICDLDDECKRVAGVRYLDPLSVSGAGAAR